MSSKKEPEPEAGGTAPRGEASSSPSSPRRPHAWSLATRLTFWYTASTFTLVLGATGILYFALAVNLRRGDKEELREEYEILRALLHETSPVDTRRQWEAQGE